MPNNLLDILNEKTSKPRNLDEEANTEREIIDRDIIINHWDENYHKIFRNKKLKKYNTKIERIKESISKCDTCICKDTALPIKNQTPRKSLWYVMKIRLNN